MPPPRRNDLIARVLRGITHVTHWNNEFLRCLDAKRHRGKVGIKEARQLRSYAVKIYCHTEDDSPKYRMVGDDVGLESPIYNVNCHPELDSGSINADFEPSPEFLSSLQLTKKFNPLTKREGNGFTNKIYSLFTTHHSLIHNDTVFSRFTSHFSLKSAAFTLAEVLITLGIIGVVTAMTMPSLMNNYRHKALETQFKKSVSIVSQAILNAKNDIGVDNFASYCIEYNGQYYNSLECTTAFNNAFNSLAKKTPDSSNWYNTGRVVYDIDRRTETIRTYNNNQVVYGETTLAAAGRPIFFTQSMPDGSYINILPIEYQLYIGVDINGAKQPNKLGHDIFLFSVSTSNDTLISSKPENYTDEELEAGGYNKDDYHSARAGNPCNKTSSQKGNGIGCAWYALRNECPDDATKSYFSCLP